MIDKYRTAMVICFIILTFAALITAGVTRIAFFLPIAIGCFVSAMITSALDKDEDGPGGVAGYISTYHPDPNGKKTALFLAIIWLLVVASLFALPLLGWTVLGYIHIADASWVVPIFILIIVAAYGISQGRSR